jgi:cation diffusion facilitator CzcD-associated flavoprotein CzcO
VTRNPDAIIVGAGPAGLACGATMRAAGLTVTVLEKADCVGAVWRRHYDRLHLHTDRNHSALPGMAMPSTYPVYPSRTQMIAYLENYAARFAIEPVFDTTVTRIGRDGPLWRAETTGDSIAAPIVVVATGALPMHPIVRHGRDWKPTPARSSTVANTATRQPLPESACS